MGLFFSACERETDGQRDGEGERRGGGLGCAWLSYQLTTACLLLLLLLRAACFGFSSQDMILLVTGRRVFMLHGGGGGGRGVDPASSTASKRHIYGVVEWEVDFGLVVWLEIDGDAGAGTPPPSPAHLSDEHQQASLSMFHFPDLCAERDGGGGDVDGSAGK